MVDRLGQVFNAQERLALLFLASSLIVGSGIAFLDRGDPDRFAEFDVIRGAVPAPIVAGGPVVAGRLGIADSLHRSLSVEETPELVELNSANVTQLERLPSIGPKMAARIVDYRRRHGDFDAVEELGRVRGIGMKTVEKLRPLIRLE